MKSHSCETAQLRQGTRNARISQATSIILFKKYTITCMDTQWESSIVYDVQIPKPFIYAYLVVNSILCLLIVAANSILIHAIRKLDKLKKVSFKFILYLSISDISIGIIQLLLQFSIILPQPGSIDAKTFGGQYAIYFASHMSGGMTVILAIDRYIHMKHLSRCNDIITKRRANIAIIGCTIINLITNGVLMVSTVYKFMFLYRMVLLPMCFIIMIGLSIVYIRAYFCIRRRVRSMGMHNANRAERKTGVRNPENEFARLVIPIIASLIICYLPSIILGTIQTIANRYGHISDYLKYAVVWSYTMAYLYSLINAIIIIIGNKQVRLYVIGMFTG